MSAGIIKALMQLFAIIARSSDNGDVDCGRDIVAVFLRQQLNKELVTRYLQVYEEFVEKNQPNKSKRKDNSRKRTSLSSVKVLRICTQINEELAQKEKFFVLIRLLEFITAFGNTGEQEWEFVETVSEAFNIDRSVYKSLKKFVMLEVGGRIDEPEFLYISSGNDEELKQAKFIHKDGLEGSFVFFRIERENMFLTRFFGTDNLLINGQALGEDRSYVFLPGASVRGSKISPIYHSDVIYKFLDDDGKGKITFRAENISYYFKRNNTQALHQLNLVEESGSLVGIMGASGSGKSTLLNVLNGNYKPSYGVVSINGVDIHSESSKIEGVLGYVAQDDLLIEELSVFQNLFFNAKLCFATKSDEELEELCNQTLNQLGLYEAKDMKVGSPLDKIISGGQRKRLNIALELIREPAVLFVDEPTSGLSSRDSENIMDLLKELTLKGKLIFVVIHQPSSDIFKMFDKLFILDQGGYPIYYGNPVESIIYFKKLVNHVNVSESECVRCGNVNPEQIFNIIEAKVVDEYGNLTKLRKITPSEWNNFFNVIIGNHIKKESRELETPQTSFKIPSRIRQIGVFLKRDVLSKLSNSQYILINSLEAPLLAILLTVFVKYFKTEKGEAARYIFNENVNIPQFLFISVIVALFLGLTVSAEEIIRDQKILNREKFLNLSRRSYLLSKIMVMFGISALQALLYVLIGNFVLEIKGMWLSYWLILFSTSCFANLLGLNISASFNSAKVIYILIPVLIIPQLLFSGVIIKFDKLYPIFSSQSSVPWIGNIMTSRWAYEALAVNQFKNNKFEKKLFYYDKKLRYYNWKKDFWIKNLRGKVSECNKVLAEGNRGEDLDYNLRVLRNEFEKELATANGLEFDILPKLYSDKIDSTDLEELSHALDILFDYYKSNYNLIWKQKDMRITELSDTPEKRQKYLKMKEDYANESLRDFVSNSSEIDRIVEYQGELVQKNFPIYLTPIHKGFFEAQFYAPTKNLFGRQVSTKSANLLVIWGMTFLMVMLLFVNGLKKFIDKTASVFESIADKFTREKK